MSEDYTITQQFLNYIFNKNINGIREFLTNGGNCNLYSQEVDCSLFHLIVGDECEDFALEATKLCLNYGGNPNLRSPEGITPTHICSMWNRTKVFSLLLLYGGDPYIKDDLGLDCYGYALKEGHCEIMQILLTNREKGLSTHSLNISMNTLDLLNNWYEDTLSNNNKEISQNKREYIDKQRRIVGSTNNINEELNANNEKLSAEINSGEKNHNDTPHPFSDSSSNEENVICHLKTSIKSEISSIHESNNFLSCESNLENNVVETIKENPSLCEEIVDISYKFNVIDKSINNNIINVISKSNISNSVLHEDCSLGNKLKLNNQFSSNLINDGKNEISSIYNSDEFLSCKSDSEDNKRDVYLYNLNSDNTNYEFMKRYKSGKLDVINIQSEKRNLNCKNISDRTHCDISYSVINVDTSDNIDFYENSDVCPIKETHIFLSQKNDVIENNQLDNTSAIKRECIPSHFEEIVETTDDFSESNSSLLTSDRSSISSIKNISNNIMNNVRALLNANNHQDYLKPYDPLKKYDTSLQSVTNSFNDDGYNNFMSGVGLLKLNSENNFDTQQNINDLTEYSIYVTDEEKMELKSQNEINFLEKSFTKDNLDDFKNVTFRRKYNKQNEILEDAHNDFLKVLNSIKFFVPPDLEKIKSLSEKKSEDVPKNKTELSKKNLVIDKNDSIIKGKRKLWIKQAINTINAIPNQNLIETNQTEFKKICTATEISKQIIDDNKSSLEHKIQIAPKKELFSIDKMKFDNNLFDNFIDDKREDCKTVLKDNEKNNPKMHKDTLTVPCSGFVKIDPIEDMTSDSFIAVAEEKKIRVDEIGVELVERRFLVTPCISENDETMSNASTDFSIPKSEDYDTDSLRKDLKTFGLNAGPITKTTKKIYVRKLFKLKKKGVYHLETETKKAYSCELEKTLKNITWMRDLSKLIALDEAVSKQFSNNNSGKKWRGGLQKASFTYLLLDPRITNNLPARLTTMNLDRTSTVAEAWPTFIESIFYIGKGIRSRPYAHLYQAVELWEKKNCDNKKANNEKVKRIIEIWKSGQGVICLNVFQHVIPVEAFTREAAMIDALTLKSLTNMKSGEYYGVASSWSCREKKNFGIYLLYRAMNIFLHEGERQIYPCDIN